MAGTSFDFLLCCCQILNCIKFDKLLDIVSLWDISCLESKEGELSFRLVVAVRKKPSCLGWRNLAMLSRSKSALNWIKAYRKYRAKSAPSFSVEISFVLVTILIMYYSGLTHNGLLWQRNCSKMRRPWGHDSSPKTRASFQKIYEKRNRRSLPEFLKWMVSRVLSCS